MKKLGFALLSLMFVALLVGGLEAKPFDDFDGEIDMPYAYRSSNMNTVLDGTNQEQDFILAPLITLNMKWALADKVSVFLQVENSRLDEIGPAGPVAGTAANVDFAGGDNIDLVIEQAYIKVEGFLSEKVTFTLGAQDLKLTLRKGEGAFFIDVAESEMIGDMGLLADVAAGNARTRGTGEFGGFVLDYGSLADDNYAATLFWGVARETGAKINTDADDRLFGVNVDYKLSGDDRNVVKALLTTMGNAFTNRDVMTIGVGVDYFGAVENLELFAEFYTQSGDYSKTGATTVDAVGQAFRLGGKYDFQHELKPYVELSIWSLSGNDTTDPTDNGDFISYENVDSTLILEDHLFGLDLDSNYTATKIEAGIETSLDINGDGTAEPVSVNLLFGQFTAAEVLSGVKDGLGTEIDITATLHYTENLSFTLAIGMLSGADFFDQFKAGDPAFKGTDSMTFISFGANVKF